ncbi:MAG: hypothetical protein AABY39_01120 [Nitrospirota bacterium]
MGKQGWKKRIESLRLRILEHENKIKKERAKFHPNEGVIKHWNAEIEAFKNSLNRALKRLKK